MIPEVVRVIPERRPDNARQFQMPKQCPVCGSEVVKIDSEATYKCTGGLSCEAQRIEAIKHFASRKAMDIEGLGDVLIETLVKNGHLHTVADIYMLNVDDISCLEGMGKSQRPKSLMQ